MIRGPALARRWLVAVTLALTGLFKFVFSLGDGKLEWSPSELLSDAILLVVGLLEIMLAAALLTEKLWRSAEWVCVAFGLLLVVVILYMEHVGIDVAACGCFGHVSLSVHAHFAILFGMVLVALSCATEREPVG